MADYTSAYQVLAQNEGGWTQDPTDSGGETYRGITRRYDPDWSGWAFLDNYRAQYGFVDGKVFSELEPSVMAYVKNKYWDPISGDAISNQQVANMILDFTYESGRGAQQINEALGLNPVDQITADTIAAVNQDPTGSFAAIKQQRLQYYKNLNAEGYLSNQDIEGVLARVERMAAPVLGFIGKNGLAIAIGILFFFS